MIDHCASIPLQLEALKLGPVDYVISLTHTDTYLAHWWKCCGHKASSR